MAIDYLGTARKGDSLRARADVYKEGASLVHVTSGLSKENTIISKAQSNVIISNIPAEYMKIINPGEKQEVSV